MVILHLVSIATQTVNVKVSNPDEIKQKLVYSLNCHSDSKCKGINMSGMFYESNLSQLPLRQ